MDMSEFILDLGWGEGAWHLDSAAILSEEAGKDAVLEDRFK